MINTAGSHPQLSGTFIPEIWSGKLLVKFYSATVLAAISNTDYEGEIKEQGDKVNIRQTPDIEIRDYTKGQTLIIQRPSAPIVTMEIDKAKYFNFLIDKIDKYQSDINIMNKWSDDAGMQMKISIDTGILADVYADADSYNSGATAGKKSGDIDLGTTGTPFAVSKANVLEKIIDLDTVLTEQDVPETDRWMVIPAWFAGKLKKSDLKDASLTGDGQSLLRNGRIGGIDNFTLYVSNLLTSVTDGSYTCWHTLAGQRQALSFAAQMTEMQHLDKLESTFGETVRGLNVYGYKVLKGQALIDLYVRKVQE